MEKWICLFSRVLQPRLNDGEDHLVVKGLSTERTCNRVLSLGRTQAVLQLSGGFPAAPYKLSIPAGTGGGQGMQSGDAVCTRDVGRCWEGFTALGPLETVSPVPSIPEVKAGDVWRGRSLWEFKAAISPQWKAGSMSVVRSEEKKAQVGTSLC